MASTADDVERTANEHTPLLVSDGRHEAESFVSSHVHKPESTLQDTSVGERLSYDGYITIDWLHELVKDSVRHRKLHSAPGVRGWLVATWDRSQGWVAAAAVGILTACIASVVDVSVAVVADWKEGYCRRNVLLDRRACCETQDGGCDQWYNWAHSFTGAYAIYVAFALAFGVVAGAVTMTTRATLPSANGLSKGREGMATGQDSETATGKVMYLAAGSGIPEIKTILSGFVIPNFLDFKVLVVKAVGSVFAVATGMCLGKEGPFVHISACVGYLVAMCFPKYRQNQRKLREMLSVACSAGLSVAFGAPIGGVLFSYEEISTYFPRIVLWRAFLCSLCASAALRELNPTGTGKLVLFETTYGDTTYSPVHYFVFLLLGIAGGTFGGVFCKANFLWSKSFRKISIIRDHPVLELSIVVLATALLQFPNRLIRPTGDIVMEELLVDCREAPTAWVCVQEAQDDKSTYHAWLITGTFVKLVLTTITFGCKVPSGIIIPALDAGALFGRMTGQLLINDISPGIFAMVGAAAFLAGVCRMTVSLAVIMFELTGEAHFIPPFMVAILSSKWVADAISADGVYDLSQHLLGHPFLDVENASSKIRKIQDDRTGTVGDLIPPPRTMDQITVPTGPEYRVSRDVLAKKLSQLKARGLMDAGLVFVNSEGLCYGYLGQAVLELALDARDHAGASTASDEFDIRHGILADLIDRSPVTVAAEAPVEYAIEMFGKLGLRYLVVVEAESAHVVGVIIKKRLLSYIDAIKDA